MRKVLGFCGAVVLISVGIFIFWWFRYPHVSNEVSVFAPETQPLSGAEMGTVAEQAPLGPRREAPSDAHEYYDESYRFSLFYPKNLDVKKIDEGSGASTIIFQNPQEGKGFQIFIVPYAGSQVSEDQFKKDVPSGVRKNVSEVVVDGVLGASFHSSSISLGETREVWFISNGFLYEVTAPRALEPWLSVILQTWKFL